MSVIDLAGKVIGLLTVSHRVENRGKQPTWRCVCSCGGIKDIMGMHLRSGKIIDCGCGAPERLRKSRVRHGMTYTPTWNSWAGMVYRCTTSSAPEWKHYGGRGITVCESWRTFENFFADMGERPEGTSIDRVDNNRGYEPGNCRWATITEQQNNRRSNVRLTINGQTRTMKQWANHYKVPYPVVKDRRSKGVDGEALFAPLERRKYKTLYTHDGKSLTITDWAKELNAPYITVWQRVHMAGKNPDGSPIV